MISYRFRRRAFMTAMSGGIGLKVLLRNLEGSAQGMRSPSRLLVTHWPVGTVEGSSGALWAPTGAGSVAGSPALQPFATAGLGPDMTVIKGLSTAHLSTTGGGGGQMGMVGMVTGLAGGGTRTNRAQGDDVFAVPGGSFDQILLQKAPALQTPGPGFANAAVDLRSDFGEVSSKVMSYSTTAQEVTRYSGGTAQEATPLLGTLSPLTMYNNLFASFVPGTGGTGGTGGGAGTGAGGGGAPPPVADAMLKKLVGKRSVLDFATEELNQVKKLAPSEARGKLGIHTDAVVAAEASIVNAINTRYPDMGGGGGRGGVTGAGGTTGAGGAGSGTCAGTCKTKPTAPTSNVSGIPDPVGGAGNPYGGMPVAEDNAALVAMVGKLHFDILKAAFICDVIRVGTHLWAGHTNHTGFPLYPSTTTPYMHHPTSHRIGTQDTTAAKTVAELNPNAQMLYNVHTWYFTRQAETFASWKTAVDGCGNNLLDYTLVPFFTEVRACGHERNNMPAMLIGGKALGFIHNRYVNGAMTVNQFWGTIAQAFGYTSTDLPFAAPVDGFWAKP